jgi:CHAT domain-containing protein
LRTLAGGTDRAVLLEELDAQGKGKRYRYIHLATHGFFDRQKPLAPLPALAAWTAGAGVLPGAGPWLALSALSAAEEPGAVNVKRGTLDLPGRSHRLFDRNPMLLAGLVLAGANRDEDRGLLTAEEVAALDLAGCELVVLSACDTGVGKLAGWQGVQGLQRAFAEAGTRAQVASLWSVSDAATSVLMEQFYTNLWQKKMPRL